MHAVRPAIMINSPANISDIFIEHDRVDLENPWFWNLV